MTKQKIHRSVAVFILFDRSGKVLLQHKAKDSKVLPDQWAFFGGGIDKGETPEQAVRREAKEELGISLKNIDFLGRYVAPFEVGLWEQFVFIGDLPHPLKKLKLQQTEGQGMGLFAREELEGLKLNKHIRKILDDSLAMFRRKAVNDSFGMLNGIGSFTKEDELDTHNC
ncbi:NUDIX hydrolase [Candidatus Woesearchaeota archaeon]|nr:NUDIX hydrolase [Candidatus Woesearchaeota archaeon]